MLYKQKVLSDILNIMQFPICHYVKQILIFNYFVSFLVIINLFTDKIRLIKP